VKRSLIIFTLFVILVLPDVAALASPPPRQAQIDLSVSAGYASYFRRGQWIPVRVNVSNTGDNLEGVIRVRSGGLEETTYQTPIDLPRGARKQVFLYISLQKFASDIQVEVVDQKGQVAQRETATLHTVDQSDILSAVVTESPYGAVDLTALAPGTGSVRQTNWHTSDVPPLADALAGLDVLMFHDVDTGTLTAEQSVAIADWVLAGGHLIVTGGDAWQRTTAGLRALLPVSLQGTVQLDSLASLADYLRLPRDPLDEGTIGADTTPKPAARTLAEVGDVPLIVRGTYGAGVVDFLAVDPYAEPLRSWSDKDRLWYTLITSVGQQPSWLKGFTDWSMAREATLTLTSTVLPTFLQLCGFLVLYVVLVGPINYLVLKRLNRREWAWVTIPMLIVLFSVLAYAVGFNLRGNVPTVNRLTVTQVWPDSTRAQVTSLIGVQSPRRSTYTVAVDRPFVLRALPEIGIGLNVPAVIAEGTRYVARSIPIDAGMIASFVASGYESVPRLDASATWTLSSDQPPHIAGTITNTVGVPLEDAVLVIKGASRVLGTLQPGETQTFDIAIAPQEPGPLTLGNARRLYSSYSYNTYSTFRYGSGSSPGWCFTHQGIDLTLTDVMNGEKFSCATRGVSDRQQEIRRRYRLLGSLVVDSDLSGGRDTGAYLFAWTNQPLVPVELQNKPQGNEDTNLYIFELPETVAASDPVVEVPPSLTTWSLTETSDPNTMLNVTPAGFQISSNSQAAFQFMPMPKVRLAQVQDLDIDFQGQGPLVVELWDWVDQTWVQMNLDPASTETRVTDAGRFVGPENAVNVRVYSLDGTTYNQVDHVKIGYRGLLTG
jgi:hypothetical protein